MSGGKLLSVIVVGRNDDYLGGYRYRLETSLNHLAKCLSALDRLNDVEVVFVDWNSHQAPLVDEVSLTAEAGSITRFVIVSPEVAQKRKGSVSFFTTCAVNVGVRRAAGQFIMLADSDSMMPLPSLDALLKVLDGTLETFGPKDELIFPIPRHQIPGAIGARRPNLAAWEIILQRIHAARRKELPGADCLGGFSAGQLMHRDLWFEFGGYSEALDRAWGWSDNELMLRVTQKYNWMDLGYYGVVAFHIEHHASSGSNHQRDPHSINAQTLTYERHPNGPDWGLQNVNLIEKRAKPRSKLTSKPDWGTISYRVFLSTQIVGALLDSYVDWAALIHATELPFDPVTRDGMTTVASFAHFDMPRNAVYLGEVRRPMLTMLTKIVPGIDLCLIQPWAEGDVSHARTTPGALGAHLAANDFRGFARIVSGPALEGLKTLEASDAHFGLIELAILERSSFGGDFDAVLSATLARLAPGGALVLIDDSGRVLQSEPAFRTMMGRSLVRAGRPTPGGAMVGPFVQSDDEVDRTADFDVAIAPGGAVHMIRRRPTVDETANIAAE
jgi:hypothetical protein